MKLLKKIFCVLSALTCTALLFSSCGHKAPTVGDISDIFPAPVGADIKLPDNIENAISDLDESIFNSDVNVYYEVSKYNAFYETGILSKFGMTKFNENKEDSNSDIAYFRDTAFFEKDGKSLEMDKTDGSFHYSGGRLVSKGDITDREYYDRLGEQKLKEMKLLPENYIRNGYTSTESGSSFMYGPKFAQTLDGKKVCGAGSVSIEFYGNDKVATVVSSWVNAEYATTTKTVSFDEAFSRIKGNNSFISCEFEYADRVVIDSVQAVYYKNSDCSYFLPAYKFSGTAYSGDKSDVFWAYVIAIPDLTDDMIQK